MSMPPLGKKATCLRIWLGNFFPLKIYLISLINLVSVKQNIKQTLLSLGLCESFYDVRNGVRYSSKAFGHLQAEASTVGWMSRVSGDRWAFPEGSLLQQV